MKIFIRILPIFLAIILSALILNAQSNQKAESEVVKLRSLVIEGIKNRDRKILDEIYAEDFYHTHATGKIDNKKTRIDVFVSGEKTIETAQAEDLRIRIFGKHTAVATGKSSIKNDDGLIVVYRWTITYAKIGKKWKIVASQATRISE